jgi:hypothetical protein
VPTGDERLKREVDVPNEANDKQAQRKLDQELDRELEDTFPASDALKITRRTPNMRRTPTKTDGRA